MAALASELEVVGGAGDAQHDAVEAIVVLERAEAEEPEPVGVEPHDLLEMVSWPCNPKGRSFLHHAPSALAFTAIAAESQPEIGPVRQPARERPLSPAFFLGGR